MGAFSPLSHGPLQSECALSNTGGRAAGESRSSREVGYREVG